MSFMKTAGLGCLTYVAIAALAFGDLLKPVFLAIFWSGRLGAPHWQWIVLICLLIGTLSFLLPARLSIVRAPLFVAISLLGSLWSVGAYAEHVKARAIREFHADRQQENSFLQSVIHAPNEPQFFLHATALKDCVPYGWSYRTMSFYRLPTNVAVNVLPARWLDECHIRRR